MRYYDLKITNPTTGATTLHYTSYPRGLTGNTSGPSLLGVTPLSLGVSGFNPTPYDPGALNVIFDIYSYQQAQQIGNSWITIEGVPQSILGNAQQFAGQYLTFSGGMGPSGLPLANPAQAGLLAQGNIFKCFGNWLGTQVDLNFVVTGSTYTMSNPGNIVLNWPAGTPLAAALQNTLKTAYPSATVQMNIANIVQNHTEVHACSTLGGLARLLSDITPTKVAIVANGAVITVADNTYQPTPKLLAFPDFIGQPMWIAPNEIQIRTVLRADIQVGDHLTMPQGLQNIPGFVQTTANSLPSGNNYKTAIQGKFVVNHAIRHIGNLRSPNANEWCSVINAATLTVAQPVAQVT